MIDVDIVLRHVPVYGWIYIVKRDTKELARGEFKSTASDALQAALAKFGGTLHG